MDDTSVTVTSAAASATTTNNAVRTSINTVALKLDENNFIPWKRQALAFIKSNGLKDHLNQKKIPCRYASEEDRIADNETQKFLEWEQDDQFLISWFFASIDPAFSSQVTNCEYAYEIWNNLEEYFAKRLKSKVKQLKAQIKTVKLQGSATEYMSRLKKITNALSTLGSPLFSEEFVDAITQGLNEDYSTFIMMISAKAESVTESEVEAQLLSQEELVERFKKIELGTIQVNLTQGGESHSQVRSQHYQHKDQSPMSYNSQYNNSQSYTNSYNQGRGQPF
ncbi:uncharacterized protein LOC107640052 [Arachis ipaensis]|uniref:uncharacterized protein LOC107640052 n=1 Tax=Arachis ipaensis TaxID=130454 RepID=UPI000A2B632C|nr:uncharacterized protein LOC107640052 [Arachis ipaensis]